MRIPDHVEKGNVQILSLTRQMKDEIANLRINLVLHLKKISKWKSALQKGMIQINVAVAFELISTQRSPGAAEGFGLVYRCSILRLEQD